MAPGEPPIHRKFGWEHAQEMREIEAQLRAEGVTDYATLHFAAVDRYVDRHKNDPTFRQRQETVSAGRPVKPTDLERFRLALEAIRDGHNDPRSLARDVLER